MKQKVFNSDHVGSQRLFYPVPKVARNSYEEIFGKHR